MLPEEIHSYDLLRPDYDGSLPATNEPVSVHVLDGPDTVLFGTGFPADFDRLTTALDGVGGPDVVVIEHAHPDHYSALPALRDRYDDLTVAAPALDADAIEAATEVAVDVRLGHDEDRWNVRTIHVPGHTPGNMSFIHEASGTLFVGDTFVHRNSFAAASGDWSGAFAPVKSTLNADDDATRENIARLTDYPFEAALVTHGLNVLEDAGTEVETLVADLDA